MTWNALVLAGSRGAADPVAQAAGVSHKAFAEIAGQPMIRHVLQALHAAPSINQIAVSIEADAASLPMDAAETAVLRIDARESPARSVLAGLEQQGTPLLVTTADNPLLTVETLEDFITASTNSGADITAGVARRETVEAAGNTAPRTYLTFKDAELSGCNLFGLCRDAAEGAIDFWRSVETERKKPWKIARHIGAVTLARYLSGHLTVDAALAQISAKAGCKAVLITLDHPDAAHDVDKAADLAFADARLRARGT